MTRVGLVGYGEVGRIFAEDLRATGIRVCAYDRKFDGTLASTEVDAMRAHADQHGVVLCNDAASVTRESDLIISAVTASQAVPVAESLAAAIAATNAASTFASDAASTFASDAASIGASIGTGVPGGTREAQTDSVYVLDVNSASPGAKQRAAALIDSAGGRYVEAAVMTSVPPYRIQVPMLLGGPHASGLATVLTGLGFAATVASPSLGVASASKMARSVMIKGLEAMVIESFTTARHYGVEDQLIASLTETFPGIDWEKQATYFFQRVIQHGRRRAEEVREVAQTVREAGLHPWSAQGTAARQDWVADLVADGQFGDKAAAGADVWRNNADKLLRAQTMSASWLPFHSSPSVPEFSLPPGSVDAHCHVFGPSREFPYALQRKYTPCDAGKDRLFALRDRLGVTRNVIVQATCHGTDNRALLDALAHSGGRARGVVSLDRSVTDAELAMMHRSGVRGVRFNFVKRLVDFTPREVLTEIAERIAPLGWHVVVYFEAVDLPELEEFFTSLPTDVVVDHMGRPDVTKPVDGPEFARFVSFMQNNTNVWAKVSCPERLSVSGPPALHGERSPYADVVPFARLIVEQFPDRVLWGTDWPHPNLTNHMPDDGLLVDYIPHIARTAELQQKLLVENPMRLYWKDEL